MVLLGDFPSTTTISLFFQLCWKIEWKVLSIRSSDSLKTTVIIDTNKLLQFSFFLPEKTLTWKTPQEKMAFKKLFHFLPGRKNTGILRFLVRKRM